MERLRRSRGLVSARFSAHNGGMAIRSALTPFPRAFQEFREGDAPQKAAALSFYAVTAIPPLVVLFTAILGLVYSGPQAAEQLVGQVSSLFGQSTGDTIAEILQRRSKASNGTAVLTGTVVLLLGASGFFVELQKALNHVWSVQPDPNAGWKDVVVKRVLSMGVVLGTGFLMLASLILSTFIAVASHWVERHVSWSISSASLTDAFLSVAMLTGVFALIYKYLPDVHVRWSDVWRGAFTTALLFMIGKFALGWYLGRSNFTADYGSAGALVLIMFWVYYSSMILLFGAELTQAHSEASGHQAQPHRHARRCVKHRGRLAPTGGDEHKASPSPA